MYLNLSFLTIEFFYILLKRECLKNKNIINEEALKEDEMRTDSVDSRKELVNSPSLYNILYLQKMTFEQARLEKDYGVMRSALQNIMDNVVAKARKEGKKKQIAEINKSLNWLDNLQYDKKYKKRMSTGEVRHVFPENIEEKVNYAFKFAYSNTNRLIEDLNIV